MRKSFLKWKYMPMNRLKIPVIFEQKLRETYTENNSDRIIQWKYREKSCQIQTPNPTADKKTQKLAGLHTSAMSLIRGNKAVSQCFCILSTYNAM